MTIGESPLALGVAAAAAGSSVVAAIVPEAGLWVTAIPALIGSLISSFARAKAGKLRLRDIPFALVTAFITGFFVGPWFAKIMPESEAAVAPMCLFLAMFSSMTVENLADINFNPWPMIERMIRAARGAGGSNGQE